MGRIGKFLKTLTLGGIVGFVAGMLFAPDKGEQTRSKLQEAIEKGKAKFNELKEGFSKTEK
jgi:gas vesicle protein